MTAADAVAAADDTPLAEPPHLDAARLVGLLADDGRRRVFSALVLGAVTTDDIITATGLPIRDVVTSLTRLVDGELVLATAEDEHYVMEQAFQIAARAAAPAEPTGGDADVDRDSARVLRAFVREGRITAIPMSRAKRLVLLDLMAQDFEPGERYVERTVNAMLGRWHDDYAAWRRYLVDEGFLTREGGEYWRSGGTVALD